MAIFFSIFGFLLFILMIFSFLYHQALMEAWHDHGFFGVINMFFAIVIHLIAKMLVK